MGCCSDQEKEWSGPKQRGQEGVGGGGDIGSGQVVSRRRFLNPGEEEEEEEEEAKVSASHQPGRGGGEAGLWNSDSEPNHCFEGCRGDR